MAVGVGPVAEKEKRQSENKKHFFLLLSLGVERSKVTCFACLKSRATAPTCGERVKCPHEAFKKDGTSETRRRLSCWATMTRCV